MGILACMGVNILHDLGAAGAVKVAGPMHSCIPWSLAATVAGSFLVMKQYGDCCLFLICRLQLPFGPPQSLTLSAVDKTTIRTHCPSKFQFLGLLPSHAYCCQTARNSWPFFEFRWLPAYLSGVCSSQLMPVTNSARQACTSALLQALTLPSCCTEDGLRGCL